jgi:hypothetical protein
MNERIYSKIWIPQAPAIIATGDAVQTPVPPKTNWIPALLEIFYCEK